jgi:hypothetical protein
VNYLARLLIGLTLVLLAGCAAAPPPEPILATGPLQGRLEKGIYHDQRGWFEIATPIAPTDPGYSAMSVAEEPHPNAEYVNFVPTQTPEFYRAYVEDFFATNHQVMAYGEIADSAINLFGRQQTEARSEPIERAGEKSWHTASTIGLLRLYTGVRHFPERQGRSALDGVAHGLQALCAAASGTCRSERRSGG